jgi:hypothetical protein
MSIRLAHYDRQMKRMMPAWRRTLCLVSGTYRMRWLGDDYDIRSITLCFISPNTPQVNIDATYEATVAKWLSAGGEVLTQEANDWFASTK